MYDVGCNRMVRRRGFMRPLHDSVHRFGKTGATQTRNNTTEFSRLSSQIRCNTLLARRFSRPPFVDPSHTRVCPFLRRLSMTFFWMSVNLMNDVTISGYCKRPRVHRCFPQATWDKDAIRAKKYVASCVWYNLYHASRVAGRNTSSLFKMA